MFLSERATLSLDGIRLPSDAIRRVGIGCDADCWGLWLPYWGDRQETHGQPNLPAHFAISPFYPGVWPCLLHIALKMQEEPGTVSRAIAHCADLGLGVLSHVFAQTGHNHGTLTLIATAPRLFASPFIAQHHPGNRGSIRVPLTTLTSEWGVPVLEEVCRIRVGLAAANLKAKSAGGQFLRKRFVSVAQSHDQCGLVFDPHQVPEHLTAEAYTQFVDAIAIRWLQYPAYYWFNCGDVRPILLHSDSSGTRLLVDHSQRDDYAEHLHADLRNPRSLSAALASIEPDSFTIRVMPIRSSDGIPIEVSMRQEYQRPWRGAPHPEPQSRSGAVLRLLTETIHGVSGNLWNMSNSMRRFSGDIDCSDLKFIVTDSRVESKRFPPLDELLRNELESKSVAERLPEGVRVSQVKLDRFGCMQIFVSKRASWWGSHVGETTEAILYRLLVSYGYLVIQNPMSGLLASRGVRNTIRNQICQCRGFCSSFLPRWRPIPMACSGLSTSLG